MVVRSSIFDSTSSDLVSRLRIREVRAWEQMVKLYGPLVYYWCQRSNLRPADAADVVQNVFTSVASNVAQYEPRSSTNFRGWLWVITRNKINDHYRFLQQEVEAKGGTTAGEQIAKLPDYSPSDTDDEKDKYEFNALLHRGLEIVRLEFEQRTWQAFWRATVEGDSTKDIAAELGVTPGAVRQAKSRVLRRLREELGEIG